MVGYLFSDISKENTSFIFGVMSEDLKMKVGRLFETSGRKYPTNQPTAQQSGRPSSSSLSVVTSHHCFHIVKNICISVVCFLLGDSPASDLYMPTFRNTLSVPSSKAGVK